MFSFASPMYFISLIAASIIVFIVVFSFKDIRFNRQSKLVIILASINFVVHFLKILIPPYSDFLISGAPNNFPYSITNLTAENLCAINTLLLPFALKSKNRGFTDCILLLSFVGGVAAIVYPIDIIAYSALPIYEICRYYLCHLFLIMVPLMTLVYEIHFISFRNWYKLPLFLLLEMLVVFVNNQLLSEIGLYPFRNDFLNPEYYNSAFVYGPYFKNINEPIKFIDVIVPSIFKKVPNGFYEFGGQLKYWPIAWAIVPCVIYIMPLSFIVFLLLSRKTMFDKQKKR